MTDMLLTENGLSDFFGVDRKRVHKLLADVDPDEVKGKSTKYSAKKISKLIMIQESERGYEVGYKDGADSIHEDSIDDSDENSLQYQKWRKEKQAADKLELANLEKKQMLSPLEAIIQRDKIVATAMDQAFDSLPVVLKRRVPDIPDRAIEVCKEVVSNSRNELASVIEERIKELDDALEQDVSRGESTGAEEAP